MGQSVIGQPWNGLRLTASPSSKGLERLSSAGSPSCCLPASSTAAHGSAFVGALTETGGADAGAGSADAAAAAAAAASRMAAVGGSVEKAEARAPRGLPLLLRLPLLPDPPPPPLEEETKRDGCRGDRAVSCCRCHCCCC